MALPHIYFGAGFLSGLVDDESSGLGVDFTDTSKFSDPTSLVQVKTSGVSTFSNPHTFFTQAGTSPKYVKNSGGTINLSPHNMFLNSGAPATQSVTLIVDYIYTFGITGTGSLAGSSGASGTATAGSPVTFVATGTTGTFTKTGSPTTMFLNRGTSATVYLATTGAIKIGLPISYGEGLVIEPAATNLLLQSQNIGATWTLSSCLSPALDATTAPNLSTKADRIIEDTNNIEHFMKQSLTLVNATVYTASVYVKAAARTRFALNIFSGGTTDFGAAWNLTTGAFIGYRSGGGTETAQTITPIGDGWYRVSLTFTSAGTAAEMGLKLQNTDANPAAESYAGDGVSGVYVWGAQMETGAVATSYIHTVTATQTRAADAVTVATSAYPHSDTNGTFIVWIAKRIADAAAADRLITLTDGTLNNSVAFNVTSADTPDKMGLSINTGGVAQVVDTVTKAGTVTASGNKAAAFYKLNDSGVVVGGSSEVVDTVCTMPTVTSLCLGFDSTVASRELNGVIQRLMYVPRRMTQTEMQQQTSLLFTPVNLPGLVAWYKADAGVYTDAGTTLATDGQTVQQWNDQSGNDYHLAQATSARRPTFDADTGMNGHQGVVFTAGTGTADTWLRKTGVNLGSSSPLFSMFIVVRMSASPVGDENCGWISLYDGTGADYDHTSAIRALAYNNNSGALGVWWNGSFRSLLSGTTSDNTPQRVGLVFNGSTLTSYKNNVVGTPVSLAIALAQTQQLTVASDDIVTSSQTGALAEIVITNTALGSTDLTNLDAYFAAKWG